MTKPKGMKLKFGTLVRLKKEQSSDRYPFSQLPVGTICSVIRKENMPAYDLLVAVDYRFPAEVVNKDGIIYAEEKHTMLVERGTWELLK